MNKIISGLWRFDGRIGRLQYVGFNIISWILLMIGFAVAVIVGEAADGRQDGIHTAMVTASVIIFVATFGLHAWATLAIGCKRLHDLDRSGAHQIWMWLMAFASMAIADQNAALATLLALANLGVYIWLLFVAGTPGSNRFGEQP